MVEVERADKSAAGAAGRLGALLALVVTLAACANDDFAGGAAPGAVRLGNLAGLAPAQVAALYGQPDFRRNDPPAEVWQYRSADCVLDLYFYGGDGGEQLVFAQSRPRSLQQNAAAGHCLDGDAAALKARGRETKL
jgi:hypothetical protein